MLGLKTRNDTIEHLEVKTRVVKITERHENKTKFRMMVTRAGEGMGEGNVGLTL